MDLPINRNKPLTMHIDLNSCFATCTQQADHLLRGKPLGIAAYDSPNGCVVSPSIEAKRFGVKVGMTVRECKLLCPQMIVRTPDPALYRDVHLKFKKIFLDYSPIVTPKSVDEAVIDFTLSENLHPDLIRVGREIKQRMRSEIGEWISCNVGIGTNRFLAKLASSLHKPDGLDLIDHMNLEYIYSTTKLTDLNGINTRFQARLNSYGVFTPTDFLYADNDLLQKRVFKSVLGRQWYYKLRGYETDDIEFKTKSIGQMYSIKGGASTQPEIARILMKLCEKTGRRLRHQNFSASGVHVAIVYKDFTYWHKGMMRDSDLYTTYEIYKNALYVMNKQSEKKPISKLAISVYGLKENSLAQETLFDEDETKMRKASKAMDEINDKYGEFMITPGIMMQMEDEVIDRISFGGVKEIENLYSS
ncbi:MAG: hypothetical protein KBC15_02600 [Candidatus Levybacteria bacterium]|nr:hypothetical protein [Candidatus Levybacteria bacterium]